MNGDRKWLRILGFGQRRDQESLYLQALIAALHAGASPLWHPEEPHLYIGAAGHDFGSPKGFHRPLKKTAFLAILAFDRAGPRTYNPRPRCFAAFSQGGVTVEF